MGSLKHVIFKNARNDYTFDDSKFERCHLADSKKLHDV